MKVKNKTKVYIDGSNMFYTQKKLGWSFDWKKIKAYLERNSEIVEARYYVGIKEGDEKMRSYLRYLNAIGFTTVTKPLKKIKLDDGESQLSDKDSGFIYKANFDVEMTADILLDKTKIDQIILFTGDSDFKYLIEKLKNTGQHVMVYSSRKTISWELKLAAREVIYLEDLEDQIKRDK